MFSKAKPNRVSVPNQGEAKAQGRGQGRHRYPFLRYRSGSPASQFRCRSSAPANPALRSAIVLQAARVALPWNVLARWSETHDRGTEPDDSGNTLQLIELELEPNLKLVIHVDRASGRIVRSRGVMEVGTRSMEFATRYSDFRSQSGRVYAAREQQFAAGQHTGYSVIEHIEFLDALPDSAFAPWLQVQAPAHTSPRILLTKVDHVLSPRIPETR